MSFQKSAELEVSRVCLRDVARRRRIHLGRYDVCANPEQRGTQGTPIIRPGSGTPLAYHVSWPVEDREPLPARGPASGQTHVDGE